jgi:PAS domain-containing protein
MDAVSLFLSLNPLLVAGTSGFVAALAALGLVAVLGSGGAARQRKRAGATSGRLVFEGRSLVASDGDVRAAFDAGETDGDDWDRAVAILGPDFPLLDAADSPSALPEGTLHAPEGDAALRIEHDGSLVTLGLGARNAGDESPDDLRPRIETAEIMALRDATNLLPFPIWVEGASGAPEWVNRAYLAAVEDLGEETETWPPARLFDRGLLPSPTFEGSSARVSFRPADGTRRHWFEVHARAIGDRALFAAANVDDAVRAETQLGEFTQTLTKTFAHLTIGLAIFDQSRRMILFNPALIDLTGLAPDFLAAKPTLVGFLDRLRERRIIPEPKDYTSWRRKMAELEAAAVDGSYSETWSLPTGQTYRVTGRPHPDGAVIFLFEDISAEISLTRRFRAELEMGQAVIDSLDEAIAVFTADGVLAMTNAAYARLWGHDPNTELSEVLVADATAVWLGRAAPSPAWGDFRDFVRQGQNRTEWSADVILRDGRLLCCRFVPLEGGGTLAGFRPRRADDRRAGGPRLQTA